MWEWSVRPETSSRTGEGWLEFMLSVLEKVEGGRDLLLVFGRRSSLFGSPTAHDSGKEAGLLSGGTLVGSVVSSGFGGALSLGLNH